MIVEKGLYGYIKNRKILTSLRTILLFALSIGIYFAGLYFLKTNKSVITVIAILGILPSAKSAVNLIMFLRFKSISKEEYTEYNNAINNLPVLYEMIFTTYEKSFYVPVLVCIDKTICGYCQEKDSNIKKLENHLSETLAKGEHKDFSIKIFSDKKSFLNRIENMNEHFMSSNNTTNNRDTDKAEVDKSTMAIFNTLKAISL